MHFTINAEVAARDSEEGDEVAEFIQFLGIGIGVHPVDTWLFSLSQFLCNCFVCQKHEFLDQLVAFVICDR